MLMCACVCVLRRASNVINFAELLGFGITINVKSIHIRTRAEAIIDANIVEQFYEFDKQPQLEMLEIAN